MAKINRKTGNVQAFGSAATGTERTVFGDTVQSDTLDANVNAAFLAGWETLAAGGKPPKEWFNAIHFTSTQFAAYLHQMGVAEYDAAQEYPEGGFANAGGEIFVSQADGNTGNALTDRVNWRPAIESPVFADIATLKLKDTAAIGDYASAWRNGVITPVQFVTDTGQADEYGYLQGVGGVWAVVGFGAKANGANADGSNESDVIQAILDRLAEDGGLIVIENGVKFDLTSLTFPKQSNLEYRIDDDLSRTGTSDRAAGERVLFSATSSTFGIVNEHRFTSAFHTGVVADTRKAIAGHDSHLGVGQNRTDPARASFALQEDGRLRCRWVSEYFNENSVFNGTSLVGAINFIHLEGITTASFVGGTPVNSLVTGTVSEAEGFLHSIDGSEMVVRFLSDKQFVVGETVVINQGTRAAPANEASSTVTTSVTNDAAIFTQPLTIDDYRGYWGIGVPPQAAGSPLTIGGRIAVQASRPLGQYEHETIDNPSFAWVDSYENVTPSGREIVLDTGVTAANRRLNVRKYGESELRGHVGAACCHVNFANAVVKTTSSFNVDSIVRNSTGDYTINLDVSNARADATVSIANTDIADRTIFYIQTTSSIRVRNYNAADTLTDLVGRVHVAAFGGDI